jgi:hypothetical protein
MIAISELKELIYESYVLMMANAIKTGGYKSITVLKALGFNFNQLDGNTIVEMIQKNGKEAAFRLKDAGFDFNKLNGWEVLSLNKSLDKSFYDVLSKVGFDLSIIVLDVFAEVIEPTGKVSKEGATNICQSLTGEQITYLIKNLGKKSIPTLKSYNTDFSQLKGDDITGIIKIIGPELICPLVEVSNYEHDIVKLCGVIGE